MSRKYHNWLPPKNVIVALPSHTHLGDKCIQNSHLGRCIGGFTVGNFVLRRRARRAVKRDSDRISDDIPPEMKILNMVIPILMHFRKRALQPAYKAARHPTISDVINDAKLFPTVYRSCKVLTSSNQT